MSRIVSPVALVTGLIGVAVLFRELIGKNIGTTLWGNDLDPHLIVWTVEWVFHVLFERLAPFDLWNANSYYPHPTSLAFSDSLLSAQLVYAPLRLLGVGMLPALYATLGAFCLAGAALTDRLLKSYDFGWGERSLVIVAAHFSLPMTSFLLGHFQLFGMQFIPPLLLALHRLLEHWRGSDLVLVTILFCLAGGMATYVVPMFGLLALLTFLVFAFWIFRRHNIADIARSLGWPAVAGSVVIAGVFCVVQLVPYLSLFGALPPQPMLETEIYSARPWSVLLHASVNSYWYKPPPVNNGYWERAAFPGFPLILLGLLGLASIVPIIKRRLSGVLEASAPAVIPMLAYAIVILAICWVLSWGPYLRLCACSETRLDLPFLAFAKFIPSVQNIRAPGRYAQFFGLPLGLLAVFGIRWVCARWRTILNPLAACLALLVLLDQMVKAPTFAHSIQHEAFYRAIRPSVPEGVPLIVLPVVGNDHLGTWANRLRQLESSTIYWGKLVVGAGSRDTPELSELIGLDAKLRSGEGSLAEIAAYAKRLRIERILVFPNDYPAGVRDRAFLPDKLPGTVLVRDGEGILISTAP